VAVSFIGGGNRRKWLICRKSLTHPFFGIYQLLVEKYSVICVPRMVQSWLMFHYILHMTTSVSGRWLNILGIKSISTRWGFFITTLLTQIHVYVRVYITLTCRKHFLGHNILLRKEIWASKPSCTLPLFLEVLVPSEESERSCICVLEVSTVLCYML